MTPWTVARQAPPSMRFSRQEYWSGLPCPPPGDLPNPRIEPRPPALRADSLPAEPPEKFKNTGMGSLSLLQGIFPTQESNWGLLHCKWILYQLSNQGSYLLHRVVLKIQWNDTHTNLNSCAIYKKLAIIVIVLSTQNAWQNSPGQKSVRNWKHKRKFLFLWKYED